MSEAENVRCSACGTGPAEVLSECQECDGSGFWDHPHDYDMCQGCEGNGVYALNVCGCEIIDCPECGCRHTWPDAAQAHRELREFMREEAR